MKTIIRSLTLGVTLLISAMSCNDEDQKASIVGNWQSSRIQYKITSASFPLPYTRSDESYRINVAFRPNGTAEYSGDGNTVEGTYSVDGDNLNTSLQLSTDVPLNTSRFTIDELTDTRLTLSTSQEGTIDHPTFGMLEGRAEVTIYFVRGAVD